jgi:hypothetical protein
MALTDQAVVLANTALPEGCAPLPRADSFRASGDQPLVLLEEEMETWADADGRAVPPQFQERIIAFGKDSRLGRERARPEVNSTNVEYHRARIVRIQT